ncbi:hypothetical protein TGRUB_432250 [Toxoplasma gondii RUB]|uniref:Uncharacterized protein n=1 Tax=Toxoplasma gondii RUB TaxID=935652 RepID=A0A086LTC0_TOXGO|nr:hypothetical protein TGRUB_432250 [Toxoplasma gondii RUB]
MQKTPHFTKKEKRPGTATPSEREAKGSRANPPARAETRLKKQAAPYVVSLNVWKRKHRLAWRLPRCFLTLLLLVLLLRAPLPLCVCSPPQAVSAKSLFPRVHSSRSFSTCASARNSKSWIFAFLEVSLPRPSFSSFSFAAPRVSAASPCAASTRAASPGACGVDPSRMHPASPVKRAKAPGRSPHVRGSSRSSGPAGAGRTSRRKTQSLSASLRAARTHLHLPA